MKTKTRCSRSINSESGKTENARFLAGSSYSYLTAIVALILISVSSAVSAADTIDTDTINIDGVDVPVQSILDGIHPANQDDVSIMLHTTNVTILPDRTKCGFEIRNFTVNVTNLGPDLINEVRLYNATYDGVTTNIPPNTEYKCGPAPAGWTLVDLHPFGAPICWYFTNNPANFINVSQSKIFTFSSAFNSTEFAEEGSFNWVVETRDINQAWHPHYPPILIDCSIPNTTKTYVGMQKNVNGTEWISNTTLINLTVKEIPLVPNATVAGINATYYRISLVDDFFCYNNIQNCTGLSGQGDFNTYNGVFSIPDESCHLIEFYSVDKVNNTEEKKEQCTFVDTTPPVGNKTVGMPSIPFTGQGIDYWVSQKTNITLDCTDMGPHPVDQNRLFWSVSSNASGTWVDGPWQNTVELPVTVNFAEDSFHDLKFYCVDHLNNTGSIDTEIFIVDTMPPNTSKDIVGPRFGTCPPGGQDDKCYIADHNSTIVVDSIDPQPHPSDNVKCDWMYNVDGGQPILGGLNVMPPFNVIFPEDSTHLLTVTCHDALNNTAVDNETFLVDSLPPNTTKTYGMPFVHDNQTGRDYINSLTSVTLNATDVKSGVNKTFYMNTLLTGEGQLMCFEPQLCHPIHGYDANWTEYTGPFTKTNESCHIIEYWSVDNLGNREPIKAQCTFVDNSPPNVTKIVGEPKIMGTLNVTTTLITNVSCSVVNESLVSSSVVVAEAEPVSQQVALAASSPASAEDRIQYYHKFDGGQLSILDNSSVCAGASQPSQCAYVSSTQLPPYAKDSILNESGNLTALNQGCGNILILSTGDPLQSGNTLSEDMEHQGCGFNPDGKVTFDCVNLTNFTLPSESLVLGMSAEWPEFLNSSFTDWMQIFAFNVSVNISINSWDPNLTHTLNNYGPNKIGTRNLADVTNSSAVNLLVADSGDAIYDTALMVVPRSCFGANVTQAEESFCGNNITEPGEECDLGELNGENNSTCSATCQNVSVPAGNESVCGNGILELPPAFSNSTEQCDLGAQNSPNGVCNLDCKIQVCTNVTSEETEKMNVTFISKNTPINITCKDVEPHPVDNSSVFYRFRISDDCKEWSDWSDWIDPVASQDGINDEITKTIYFAEDSCHELEYYCADALGNSMNVSREIDVVDSKPPVINKTIIGPMHMASGGEDPLGDLVGGVNFSVDCASGIGVGITYDGDNLWYSCFDSSTDLLRADPFTGNVTASYQIQGGLGALAYDATRNAIWAGWGGPGVGNITLIHLDASKNVTGKSFAFTAVSNGMSIDDGLAFDASDDTLYVSPDVSPTIFHYTTNGTLLGSFPKAPGSNCGNSGLALGGSLLYEGFNGCSQVIVVDKASTSVPVFNFSTVVAGDPNFRDEDLECDTNTFASIGKHVMWSKEAFSPMRAHAFEIPFGSCGIGGQSATNKTFIDGVTIIRVEAKDQQPHPSDNVKCDWSYTVKENQSASGGQMEIMPPFDIHFPEESTHKLNITCRDALNNTANDMETFIVDKTPPVTNKTYGEPFFTNGTSDWINSETNITLSVEDAGPHKSGINATHWRSTLVDDANCLNADVCQTADGSGSWNQYTGPFNIPEDSCHLIEFYSVDNVNKTENIKKQCVFVDNMPPLPDKTVGEPASMWDGKDAKFYNISDRCWSDGEDSIACWKVTTLTPITLDCTDPEPHPVDHSIIAFMVDFDGSDKTEDYCDNIGGSYNETGDGFCVVDEVEAPVTIRFGEESEHNLKFYCSDALGNTGPEDEEKFKVEGRPFEIPLFKKWNLISVPFPLLNSSIEEMFNHIENDTDSVWAYDNGTWLVWTPGPAPDTLSDIQPGFGYWVLVKNDTKIKIGGSLFSPIKAPPSRDIPEGWSLIGPYGTKWQNYTEDPFCQYNENPSGVFADYAYCSLNSLVDIQGNPGWAGLWTYVNCGSETPGDPWKGINACTTSDNENKMVTGYGYWVLKKPNAPNVYAPASVCKQSNSCVYFTPS